MTKVCTRCKKNKSHDSFRVRHEKRPNKGNFKYLNGTCRECDSEMTREYIAPIKKEQWYKDKNSARSRKYYREHNDIVLEKSKYYRETQKAKAIRKKYIKKNKQKIFEQESVCKKKYSNYHRDNLTDQYIVRLIVNQTPLQKKQIPHSLIKVKRSQILLIRTINQIKNETEQL